MPKLLQIDSCLGILSTGKITESIAVLAMSRGWECHIAHGARCIGQTVQKHIQVSRLAEEYLHFGESFLFDVHGLGSRYATKRLISKIREIKPDVIQLHCIHGYYINYKLLFEYLNSTDIPIVWTFHDCWAFTGHCAFFDTAGCNKWKTGCHNCELTQTYPRSLFMDRSQSNFVLKQKLFRKNRNLTVIGVSDWISNLARQSFFKDCHITTIHNGTDLGNFFPDRKETSGGLFKILGVAAIWDDRKGLRDFHTLRELLPQDRFSITLIGLSDEQVRNLPNGINGIGRTSGTDILRQYYSDADVFVNPTYSDTFPTTNIEALACGTPIITYDTGGSPEAIDERTGIVVTQGDIQALSDAIKELQMHPLSSEACRERAVNQFNRNDRFLDYVKLYETLINSMQGNDRSI